MRISFFQTALVLSRIATSFAFKGLSVPSTVAADTDVKLQITNDLSSSSSFDAQFDGFRVYLSVSAPGSGSGPSCYLVNSSTISTTEIDFQIPASVGPDATSYSIVTEEFNQSPYAEGPSGYEYSNDFSFTGGKGKWSAYELAGQVIGDADNVPCTAYDCARNCSQTFYPANVNNTDAYKSTYECIAACPGVTYDSWADVLAGNTTDGSIPTGSVTEVGTQSTTISGTTASSTPKTTTLSGTAIASTTGSHRTTSTTATSSAATPSNSKSTGHQTSGTGLALFSTVLVGVFAAFGC